MNEISLQKKETIFSYVLLVPLVVMVVVVSVYPVVYAIILSFTDRDLFGSSMNFVGLDNFRELVTNKEFWTSLYTTLVYTVLCTLIQVVLGLFVSLLLVEKFRGNYYFRAILTFPYLVPTIVAVLIFQWMLNDVFGIVNRGLISLGILNEGVGWFDAKRAMFSVTLVSVWRFFPFAIMLFVPSLEAIPKEHYEAAKVDGASAVQRFLHVTIPNIKEVLFVVIILRGIWMFNMFDIIWLLTGGGPIDKTQTLPVYSFLQAFQEYDIGMASATATAGLVFLVIIMSFYLRVAKK